MPVSFFLKKRRSIVRTGKRGGGGDCGCDNSWQGILGIKSCFDKDVLCFGVCSFQHVSIFVIECECLCCSHSSADRRPKHGLLSAAIWLWNQHEIDLMCVTGERLRGVLWRREHIWFFRQGKSCCQCMDETRIWKCLSLLWKCSYSFKFRYYSWFCDKISRWLRRKVCLKMTNTYLFYICFTSVFTID